MGLAAFEMEIARLEDGGTWFSKVQRHVEVGIRSVVRTGSKTSPWHSLALLIFSAASFGVSELSKASLIAMIFADVSEAYRREKEKGSPRNCERAA